MAKTTENTVKNTWTTWEELLLACAVKRYGLKGWDSVAMELQNRSSLPLHLTAQTCKNKYQDLKRRFMENTDDEDDNTKAADEVDTIPWLEELRNLRVAELKQEVHRYDLSIQSLQLKVKILQEERERSFKEIENGDEKLDLEKDLKEERSENDKKDGDGKPNETSPENLAWESVSGEDSERQNWSFNESNSTENRRTGVKDEGRDRPEPVETGIGKPDRSLSDSKPTGEDSHNDSSDTYAKHAPSKPSQEKKIGAAFELRESAAESKEGTKESRSDVQSSASLTNKRPRNREASGGSIGGDDPVVSPATTKRDSVKSEPLVGFLDIIRSHKHGSVFMRRLESQKRDKYKNLVRQHVDLETVQTRLGDGSYSSCTSKFYRDLLLIFNNAIVFFPKASSESVAAYELRDLILKETKKRTWQSDPSPESASKMLQPKPDPERSDSLLAKHKSSSAPIVVVCRKRSSISAKASTANKTQTEKQTNEKAGVDPKPPVKSSPNPNEEQSPTKMKTKERPVTGARSLRKDRKGNDNQTTLNPSSNTNKRETSKSGKKKTDATASSAKKQGAADFLKRIKKNSPAKGVMTSETLKSSRSDAYNNGGGRSREQNKRREGRKDGALQHRSGGGGKQVKEERSRSKRSVGRPPKKARDAVPAKRGREGGDAEAASKRPKKRSRR